MKELTTDIYDQIHRQLGLYKDEINLINSMNNISFEFYFNDVYTHSNFRNNFPINISIVKTTRKGNGFTGTTHEYHEDITSMILELVHGFRKLNTDKE